MKSLLLIIAVTVVIGLVSCQDAKQTDPLAQTSSEENQVRQAVQSFYDDFNAHNFGRVGDYTTED